MNKLSVVYEDDNDGTPTPPPAAESSSPYTVIAHKHEHLLTTTNGSSQYWHLARRFAMVWKKNQPRLYENLDHAAGVDPSVFVQLWPKGIRRLPHCGMMNLNVFLLLGGNFTEWIEMHCNHYGTNAKMTTLMKQGERVYRSDWRKKWDERGHIDYEYCRNDAPGSGAKKRRKRKRKYSAMEMSDAAAEPVSVPVSKRRKTMDHDNDDMQYRHELTQAIRLSQENEHHANADEDEYRRQMDHAIRLSQENAPHPFQHHSYSSHMMSSPYHRPHVSPISPYPPYPPLHLPPLSPYPRQPLSPAPSRRPLQPVAFGFDSSHPVLCAGDENAMPPKVHISTQNSRDNNTTDIASSGATSVKEKLKALNEELKVKPKAGTKAVSVKQKVKKEKVKKKREKLNLEQNTTYVTTDINLFMSGTKEFAALRYKSKSIIGAVIVDYLRQHQQQDVALKYGTRDGMRELLGAVGDGNITSYHFAGFHIDDRVTKNGAWYVPDEEIAKIVKDMIIDHELGTDEMKKRLAKGLMDSFRANMS